MIHTIWPVDKVVELAIQASFDCFGHNFPPARTAYGFLRQVFDDSEGEYYPEMGEMPEEMPQIFFDRYFLAVKNFPPKWVYPAGA